MQSNQRRDEWGCVEDYKRVNNNMSVRHGCSQHPFSEQVLGDHFEDELAAMCSSKASRWSSVRHRQALA